MSTLLTPIITQMELDRDRFKKLVNGTETETVDLEGRTEKSISGQVSDRIDALSYDFVTAKDQVVSIEGDVSTYKSEVQTLKNETQTLRDDALSYKTSAEGARDQTASYASDVQSQWTEVNTKHSEVLSKASTVATSLTTITSLESDAESHKTEAQGYKDAAQQAAADANTTYSKVEGIAAGTLDAMNEPLGVSPNPLYPSFNTNVDSTIDFVLIATPPNPINNARFSSRVFIMEEFDSINGEWVQSFSEQRSSLTYTVQANTLDPSKDYRWKCEDTFQSQDQSSTTTYTTRKAPWIELSFIGSPTGTDYVYLNKPTVNGVSIDGLVGTITLDVIDPSTTGSLSAVTIKDVELGSYVTTLTNRQDINNTVDLTTFDISHGILLPGKEYEVRCLYRGASPENPYTPWSDPVTFTTQGSYVDVSGKRDKVDISHGISTSTTIDYKTGDKLHRLSVTDNPTVSLINPDPTEFVEVFLRIDGGSTDGTLTFGSSITWDGGISTPALGSTWSMISLKWIGDEWIGKVESKN